ncbi:MAG: hypothetical protein KDG51_17165, partial [Calditrichaeota bacterium]|nr:hypothetical protein [Calditrichota bacterium]
MKWMHLLIMTILVAFLSVLARDSAGDAVLFGVDASRNMVSYETNVPAEWDPESGLNIKWTARLGSQTYTNPLVTGGKIFIATNN